jgi:hypothetical protein
MSTGKEWLEKRQAVPTSEDLKKMREDNGGVSVLEPTPGVEKTERQLVEITREALGELELGRALDEGLNRVKLERSRRQAPVFEKKNPSHTHHERKEKHVVSFNYPLLGITFSGELDQIVVQNKIIPELHEALTTSGYSAEEAREKINKSLGEVLSNETISGDVERILHNMNYELLVESKSKQQKTKKEKILSRRPDTEKATNLESLKNAQSIDFMNVRKRRDALRHKKMSRR